MEKETLTLYKIKKDLMRIIISDIKITILSSIILLPLLAIVLSIYVNLSDDGGIIGNAIIIAVTGIVVLPLLYNAIYLIVLAIKIRRGNFTVETDTLIGKEESENIEHLRIFTSSSIWDSMQRKGDTNHYKLYFKCNEEYEIFFQQYYKWSSQYSMGARGVFITSDVGDTFTLVKFKNRIAMAYNNRYFEPEYS